MPDSQRTAPAGVRSQALSALLLAVGWLGYFTALQWSVVRYRLPIVATLTVATLALAAWQARRWPVRLSRPSVALALAGSALATLAVPLFSYLGRRRLAAQRGVPGRRSSRRHQGRARQRRPRVRRGGHHGGHLLAASPDRRLGHPPAGG
jgi:hypothetical protein